ncbi:MAG TPA: porin, partial [Thermoanaerobaculia bacterium]|nr:porin [Thermoanaerobaculia bacterium]
MRYGKDVGSAIANAGQGVGGAQRAPRLAWLLIALLVAVGTPRLGLAADEVTVAADDDAGGGGDRTPLEITGFVDGYYGYNFNHPPGVGYSTPLRNFDTKNNQLSLSLIEVALEQKPTTGRRVGFRADLDFGPTTDLVHAAEPGGADVFKNFEQAYVSYLAPLGGGLQLDVGKFVTPLGAEVIEAKDNWNYSRSLLFALAIPYYHVGLRAALPVGERLTLTGYLVNGWNNAVENNSRKTFGLSAALKPSDTLTLIQNVMTGPEQANDDSDRRLLADTVVTWNATPTLSLMANYDYGRDEVAGQRVTWKGVAAYGRLQVTDSWALAPRVEWFRDEDGFMTG